MSFSLPSGLARRISRSAVLLPIVCATLVPLAATGADDGTDASITVVKELQEFVVQPDGSFVLTQQSVRQVNEQRAVAGAGQRQFHFNRTVEEVEVLEAYNQKPDGRRIPVLPEQVKLQQEPAYSGAPMFQDMQVKTLIYSDVAVGDVLYSTIRRTRRVALFSGQFDDVTYPEYHPTGQYTVIYDMPASMALKVDDVGYKAAAPTRHDGRTVYRWDLVPAENPRLEADTVAYWDFGRRLVVSTFGSYADVGLAYDRAAAPAAAPGPAVAARARALAEGLATPRAKALAIADWVRKNIRYVAVYIGNGGVVPHSADSVLANRYGDCKDHTTLMEAMLRAVGIASTPALINAGNSYKLSPVASLGQLNHAITYVPALDLFLDSTAEDIAPGYLPTWELDKDAILTRTGALAHTPVTQPGAVKSRFRVRIAADGAATFQFTRDQTGWLEDPVRFQQRNWRKADQDRFVETLLASFGMKGSGTVERGDLGEGDVTGPGKGYSYTLRGKADNWMYLPGTMGMAAASSLYIGLANQVFALTGETARTQPFVCPENDFDEEADYEFPAGATLLAVPPDVHVASPYFQYDARFTRRDGQLHITRRFKSGKAGTRVCTPQDHAAMQADIRRMVRDLRSQFILQVPDGALTARAEASGGDRTNRNRGIMGIIDFREIVSGKADHASVRNAPVGTSALPDDFETFCRDFFESLRGMTIFEQISRGPDNGIDLGVEEACADGTRIRWLVSCKHKAHSGASVTEDEEKNILERVYKWECGGFIPFYTTLPSATVKSNIEGVAKAGKRVDWHLKDRIERELLGSAAGVRMAARYFPKSMVNHYSTFIATMQTYSASDVVVDDDGVASIAGFRRKIGQASDDTSAALQHLAKLANLSDTMEAHKPYFVKALNDAIGLAPDFFDCRKSPVTLADFAHVSPTWCSYSLYRASIDRKNGRGLAFAYFVGAVWSFWDHARANRVFAEMRALRGRLSLDDDLTPDQVASLRASEEFKESARHHMAQGYLSVGLVGILLQEQMRDIVTRLFAYTNPIPDVA